MSMNRAERQSARLALGRDAVLTEATAIELLPFSDMASRTWLRDRELVHVVPELGRCVIWGEVISALRNEADRMAERAPRAAQAAPSKLPRKELKRSKRGTEAD